MEGGLHGNSSSYAKNDDEMLAPAYPQLLFKTSFYILDI
jgi:hypothetical protein